MPGTPSTARVNSWDTCGEGATFDAPLAVPVVGERARGVDHRMGGTGPERRVGDQSRRTGHQPAEEEKVEHALLAAVGQDGELREVGPGWRVGPDVLAGQPEPVGAAHHEIAHVGHALDDRVGDLVGAAQQAVAVQHRVTGVDGAPGSVLSATTLRGTTHSKFAVWTLPGSWAGSPSGPRLNCDPGGPPG